MTEDLNIDIRNLRLSDRPGGGRISKKFQK